MSPNIITGQYIDLFNKKIFPAAVEFNNGFITAIRPIEQAPARYILPGFIDAHIHIESSMLIPSEFAKVAVLHGTVATVSDPHEIANVCGINGIRFMIENARQTNFKFYFGAPSCVPATSFETAGATIGPEQIDTLLQDPDIWYLSEMMNYPGVLYDDAEVMAKIAAAIKHNKPIDGHAPGLRGPDVMKYISAGISTDHECFTLEEALEKANAGMKILIREGSAARNFEALASLLASHPDDIMFCCDDKHPDELLLHHINNHVKRALAKGHDLFNVLRAACVHPVEHYNLPVGLLREGDPADFIVVDNLSELNILQTYINGIPVAANGKSFQPDVSVQPINNFSAEKKYHSDFSFRCHNNNTKIRVIEAIEGQLVTNELLLPGKVHDGMLVSDVENDILKIVVVDRYTANAAPAIAFIKNFGLKHGAIASTVAHDCHNIIAVGVDDESICAAVNALIECKGGIAVVDENGISDVLPLPIAGLMSTDDATIVAAAYERLTQKARSLGSTMHAPFMTLSFMALLVIPSLKLSDKGLFDGKNFRFTDAVVQ